MISNMAFSLHVSLAAEEIFRIGNFPVTNTMIMAVMGYALTIWLFWHVARRIKAGRRSRFVTAFQWLFEILLNTIESVTNDRQKARSIAPLAITLFFFIIINYWIGILPIVGPITYGPEASPVFRGAATDLNLTFALAIISMVAVQIYAIQTHGLFGNLRRYFINPLKDPAHSFEGFLELIAEFSRLVALSLRLFGNVFAGEILVAVIAALTLYATPVVQPFFLLFELFIGAIQAYVFFMLTVVFIGLGSTKVQHHGESERSQRLEPVGAGGTIQ